MLVAFAWGLLSASSLVIGAVLAARFSFSQRVAGDWWLDRRAGGDRKDGTTIAAHAGATAIMLGIVLDGIPESAVIGLTLIEGGVSVTMVVAVFLSNLPEGLIATSGMRKGGWDERTIYVIDTTLGLLAVPLGVPGKPR